MIEIIICEDNHEQREQLRQFVSDYVMIEAFDMKISLATANPEEVLEYVKTKTGIGLYFLDVDLQAEYDGIILASKIRQYDRDGAIVFVTTHPELTAYTFIHKVAALDYIIKTEFNEMKSKVSECIRVAYERYTTEPERKKRFQINFMDKSEYVDYDDILFFEIETDERKVILYTKTKRVKFSGKLKDIVSLDSCFFRCHNSFVVNINNISRIDKNGCKIYMVNGETCEASRRGLTKLESAFKERAKKG